jgi:uncharacterized alpha-E superfamily protein
MLDKLFPRSMAHSIRQAELSLYTISGTQITNGFTNRAEKLTSKLRAEIEFTEIEDIFKTGLHQYLDHFQSQNNEVGSVVFETYFDIKPIH